MKRLVASLIFCFCFFLLSAQDSDIQVLLGHPESKQQTIFVGRNFMRERIFLNDTNHVSSVFNYLVSLEDENYLVFYPEEIQLYNYWLCQYNSVFDFVNKFNAGYINGLYKKKYYPAETEMMELIERARAQRFVIYARIDDCGDLNDEDRDFLKLNFDQQLSWGKNKDIAVDSLTIWRNNFLKKYPESTHAEYVKNYTGVDLIDRKWIYSAEYFIGAGIYTGKLGEVLSPALSLGISLDFRYRHFAVRVIDHVGFVRLRDSVRSGDVTFSKGLTSFLLLPGVSLGYYVIDGHKNKIFPFAGIAAHGLEPLRKGFSSKNQPFSFMPTLTCGVSMDLFLRESRMNEFNWMQKDHHYLRLTYTFCKVGFTNKYSTYASATHNLTVGFVMQANPQKRLR